MTFPDMKRKAFDKTLRKIYHQYEDRIRKKNKSKGHGNGWFTRYKRPVLTRKHTPPHWRFDLNYDTNPHLLERMGINTVFNAGAIAWKGNIALITRTEGVDVKSFFAVAESLNGIDNFRFWDEPIAMPETPDPDMNVYDIRLTQHEDGWIYGLFCTERKDKKAPAHNTSAAIAQCGIARTKDLKNWERLPDLKTPSSQQRNAVLHPEFVDGKYGFYTRPMDGFIDTGSGGGIGWGMASDITNAEIKEEIIIDERAYHTVKEVKNGQGPPPIKTPEGWLHLAHGVRHTAAGLRYVLYLFMSDLQEPWRITHRPGGHFLEPLGPERVGDVSNVAFCNGWVARENGEVFIYYASSDTRMHVATTTVDILLDYVKNTPEDGGRTFACATQRIDLARRNSPFLKKLGDR